MIFDLIQEALTYIYSNKFFDIFVVMADLIGLLIKWMN